MSSRDVLSISNCLNGAVFLKLLGVSGASLSASAQPLVIERSGANVYLGLYYTECQLEVCHGFLGFSKDKSEFPGFCSMGQS